jgi:hypothetical protein
MRFTDATTARAIRWQEGVRFVLWALAGDKLKASLTIFGAVIGITAIVLVVTIASTGKVYPISQIEGGSAPIWLMSHLIATECRLLWTTS